jgi:hypothetical protein
MDELEKYILNRENAMTINEKVEKYALALFAAGKSTYEVMDLVHDRHGELGDYAVEVIVMATYEIHKEKSIPLKNKP